MKIFYHNDADGRCAGAIAYRSSLCQRQAELIEMQYSKRVPVETIGEETWLWTGNGFKMPLPDEVHPPENLEQKILLMLPSPDRSDKRAETSERFARVVFKTNNPENTKLPKGNGGVLEVK